MQTLFIAGTDTDVGKTFFCAHFLRYLIRKEIKAGYQKWISTGDIKGSSDLEYCVAVAGQKIDARDITLQVPCRFGLPASPHLAAEQEALQVDVDRIIDAYNRMAHNYDLLIVEGIGGLLVPLRRDLMLIDVLGKLRPDVLLVARSGLGTLNHTLLSLEALRRRDIPVLGVVFSDSNGPTDEVIIADNMKTIAELGNIRVFGRLPRLGDHDSRQPFQETFEAVLAAIGEVK